MSTRVMTTPTEALLHTLWLASPALPVGGFSYSEGLEAALEAGDIHNEGSAAQWLQSQAQLSLARCDLPALLASHAAWCAPSDDALRDINQWLAATRESAELRLQTNQMGRSLVAWAAHLLPAHDMARWRALALDPPAYPLIYGCVAAARGCQAQYSATAYAFAWAENLVQALVKAMPLGQSQGQRLLQGLLPVLQPALAQAPARAAQRQQWQSFSPMLAIRSAQHEHQYARLFRS
jgi:urease accessory protein